MKRVVYIGSFGHWPQVAAEFAGRADVINAGVAPAYEGESVAVFKNHSAFSADPEVYASAEELLSRTRPELAVVSTRPDQIARNAILAAEAGCDIICEKPIGVIAEETAAVCAAVQKSGVHLLPMLSMRTDAVFLKARELYADGAIGEATLISTQKSYPFGERQEWFGDRQKYGGTFPWVGIHAVDMIQFITGLEFISVTARHANFCHGERPDCEDSCAAVFALTNGAFATVTADYQRPRNLTAYGDDRIRIAGTKGVLEAVSNEKSVRLLTEDGEQRIDAVSDPVPFYSRLLGKSDHAYPQVNPADGFMLTNAMIAARDSADRGGDLVYIKRIN